MARRETREGGGGEEGAAVARVEVARAVEAFGGGADQTITGARRRPDGA